MELIADTLPPAPPEEQAERDPRERELVERMLAGETRAMEEFADVYFPGVYRFALSRLRGNRELARDLVQATVCKALAKLSSFRGEAPLLGWLCACCRNEIAMHYRRQSASPWVDVSPDETSETPFETVADVGPAPDDALLRAEESRLVHAALEDLPPRYALALEWKYIERLPVLEIADRLGLGLKAAESLLTRARQSFREVYLERSRRQGGLPSVPIESSQRRPAGAEMASHERGGLRS